MNNLGMKRPGSVVYVDFDTFGGSGESLTLTGLAVTGIEVYKNGSITQRSSDAGFTLLDTDGIDFDGKTGIHGVSIDLADNTDAGFWEAGAHYRVVIEGLTINSQTVRFTAAIFEIGYPSALLNTKIATLASQTSFTLNEGPAEDGALAGLMLAIHDVASKVQVSEVLCISYTGSTKTVTLAEAPTFTAAATDNVSVLPTQMLTPTARANLQAMYDTTGYTDGTAPASRDQVDGIGAASGAALNYEMGEDNTGGAIIGGITFVGAQTGTYVNTEVQDGVYHQIDDTADAFDIVYGCNIGGGRTAVNIVFKGYLNSGNDSMTIQAYDHVGAGWDTIATVTGQAGSTNITETPGLLSKHTGTGAELGNVYIRFVTSAQSNPVLFIDQLNVQAVNIGQSVGYADGAIWVDSAGTAGSENFVNGTADNPCPWANALTISASLGISRFRIASGETITLTANSDNYTLVGSSWFLALGGQSIEGLYATGCAVTGVGTATTTRPQFVLCHFGAATIPPCIMDNCGIGKDAGTFTAGSAGDYDFHNCYSLVPGSGSPLFIFSGLAATSNIGNRGWNGGANYTLDSDCILSHEVSEGGGTTVTAGGADVEIRGICRSLTLVLSGAGTVQFVGITGPVTISGTTTAVVNLYGFASGVTDTSVTAVLTNKTISQEYGDANWVGGDADSGTQTTILDKMLAYTRLLARGDAAVAADDATELSEINNDAGSGAGTYDPADDANEAIRNATLAANVTQLLGTAVLTPNVAGVLPVDLVKVNGVDVTGNPGSLATEANQLLIKAVTDALTVAAATKLAISAGQMYTATVDHTGFTATTTIFECDDITTVATDHWKPRFFMFTSGTLAGHAAEITAYSLNGGRGRFTVNAMPSAPADNVTGLII